ncbi:MAG: hypothetical protein ABIO70_10690 [Pseudomonadota bacterium]
MSTKTCPSCGAEVPTSAARCKHCFHDFAEAPRKRSGGLLLLLFTIAAMVCVGAVAMYYVVHEQAVKRNVVIDEESASIIWTTTSSEGTSTERLRFADIKEIEFVIGGKWATWEVYAVTPTDDHKLLSSSDTGTLEGYAQHIANVMDKPVVEIRNLKNFDEKYTVDN